MPDAPLAALLSATSDRTTPRATASSTPTPVYTDFAGWAESRGLPLYPAQEEAMIELVSGANVILSTPTGTGKSLVAIGAHAAALAQGKRSYYTAPIKALVSEKFFALVDIFGAENVGMVTGDSSVNADAPIICCTAEILANLALRHGADADGRPGRDGRVPLLRRPRPRLGVAGAAAHAARRAVRAHVGDARRRRPSSPTTSPARTGRETALITGVERPVPLHYSYATTPVHETVEELLHDRPGARSTSCTSRRPPRSSARRR